MQLYYLASILNYTLRLLFVVDPNLIDLDTEFKKIKSITFIFALIRIVMSCNNIRISISNRSTVDLLESKACVNENNDVVNQNQSDLLFQPERKMHSFPTTNYVSLVEDQKIIVKVQREFLLELGCDVDIAVKSVQTLKLNATNSYDLIPLDTGLLLNNSNSFTKTLRLSFKNKFLLLMVVKAL